MPNYMFQYEYIILLSSLNWTIKNFVVHCRIVWLQVVEEENLRCKLGFFLHIPFPSWDIMRLFPWDDEILQGILGKMVLNVDIVKKEIKKELFMKKDCLVTNFIWFIDIINISPLGLKPVRGRRAIISRKSWKKEWLALILQKLLKNTIAF